MDIKDKIKFVRGNIPVHIFAVRIGVNPSMVYKYEQGKAKPGYDTLQKIMKEFPECASWLMNESHAPSSSNGVNQVEHETD